MGKAGIEVELRPDVSATDTDYGMVLLDGRSGGYWQLNDTGAEIVRRLLGGAEPDEVVGFLVAEYEVGRTDAERDVRELVDGMLASGMVVR